MEPLMTRTMRKLTYVVGALSALVLVLALLVTGQSSEPLLGPDLAAAQADRTQLDEQATDPDDTESGALADDAESDADPDDTESDADVDNAQAQTPREERIEAGRATNESLRTSIHGIGNANLSFDLRLVNAAIHKVNLDSNEQEFVRYEFGTAVDRIVDESSFILVGLDPNDVVTSEVALRDEGDLNTVLVGFPARTDVFSYTLASVRPGAVETVAQEGNIPDSRPLEGSNIGAGEGRTTGPDLISVDIQPNLERAVYVFDEQLDERQNAAATNFGFYTLSGIDPRGTQVVSIEDNTVTVVFDEENGDQIEDAVRLWVLAGAVTDTAGNANPVGTVGDPTTAPDLQSVEDAPGQTQYDFVFDSQVTGATADAFAVYTGDGNRYVADSVARPDGNSVRAAFPQIEDFADEIVLASVEANAVRADRGFDTPNTVGATPISGNGLESARTTGPDLIGVNLDAATGQAVLTFDEDIDDDLTYNPDDLFLITASGRLVAAEAIVESDDRTMIVTFRPNVAQAASGLTINTGAVQDFQANINPLDTLEL